MSAIEQAKADEARVEKVARALHAEAVRFIREHKPDVDIQDETYDEAEPEGIEYFKCQARTALAAACPAGFVCVPREPTALMVERGDEALPITWDDPRDEQSLAEDVWRAMIEASPAPTPGAGEVGRGRLLAEHDVLDALNIPHFAKFRNAGENRSYLDAQAAVIAAREAVRALRSPATERATIEHAIRRAIRFTADAAWEIAMMDDDEIGDRSRALRIEDLSDDPPTMQRLVDEILSDIEGRYVKPKRRALAATKDG